MKKSIVLLALVLLFIAAVPVAAQDIPREESLTTNGQQWGIPVNFNPFAVANIAWPIGDNRRAVIYEHLYMYNMLTNENEPFLADGPIVWEDDYNIVVKIKPAAHWSDGEPLTADDVLFTYNAGNPDVLGYVTQWSDVWTYLEKIEKIDDYTVRFTIPEEPYNVHMLPSFLSTVRILPEHFWQPLIDGELNEITALQQYFNEDPIGSGAFKLKFWDETRIVLERDDNYWGQDASMFGKLTEVKYFVHPLYENNDAGNLAFSQGEVDVSQQFLPNVWELQDTLVDAEGNSLVTTYFPEAPYQLGYSMPSLVVNIHRPGLDDFTVRKAIALSLDFEAIGTNAMSGYTEPIEISLFNNYLFKQYLDYDDEEMLDLMWDTTDLDGNIAAANALLDEAGYADVDGDGLREMPDGSKIEWKATCPAGWSDWNMTLEILSESAKKIGLNITTDFPEFSVVQPRMYAGDFDIIMWSPFPDPSIANPWRWAWTPLYSKDVPALGEAAFRNFNRYTNERVDELLDQAAASTDMDEQVEIYTEINKIWLSELPTIPLMYRPTSFQTTYEGIWTGFAKNGDGTNTPPIDCTDQAAIKDLYNLTPAK